MGFLSNTLTIPKGTSSLSNIIEGSRPTSVFSRTYYGNASLRKN